MAPRAAEIDASAEFPWDVVEALREHDIMALPFSERYGGTGTGTLMLLVAIEELSKVCATTGLILAGQALGAIAARAVTEPDEQKERYLPRLASGEWLPAYALTEPGSGSDCGGDGHDGAPRRRRIRPRTARSGSSRTRASRTSTPSSREATRTPITAASPASSSRTERPGSRSGRIEPKMGIKGSTTGELFFTDCVVPAENRLGEEGEGFAIAMRVLDRSRPGVAAQALGIGQGATDYALEYARDVRRSASPSPSTSWSRAMLADMETKCEAARGLLYRVGRMLDEGVDGPPLTKASAMAKLFCSDVAMEVTTDAVQMLGGYGYMREYPVERMMRDAKITQIYEGTNQVQRLVIAREMLREQRAFLLAGVS